MIVLFRKDCIDTSKMKCDVIFELNLEDVLRTFLFCFLFLWMNISRMHTHLHMEVEEKRSEALSLEHACGVYENYG